MTENNPLLSSHGHPNDAPAFDKIKTAHYMPALKKAIDAARLEIEKIKSNPDKPDFKNSIEALETSGETLDLVASVFYNQLSAIGGDELHALAGEMGPVFAAFGSDVSLDPKLFKRVKAVWDKRGDLDLSPEQFTLLENSYLGFVRSGALLGDEDKAKLREIDAQLSTLSPQFMSNVSKSSEKFSLHITDDADLKGLPQTSIDAAALAAKEKGKDGWIFNLEMPSYAPFMQFADNRDLREKMWRAFTSRGSGDENNNDPIILKTVTLREKRAKLLGYNTHGEYVLEKRMAKTPANVLSFIKQLKGAYKPAAQQDLQSLKDFSNLGENLKQWDTAYYAEKLSQEKFNFSSEDLRPYFPLQTVLSGIFKHFEKLFGLRFEVSDKYPTWHKDVQTFDVYDGDKLIGTLYTDFYPRKGKQDGAWKTTYRNQGLHNGKVERPLVAIVCNFTKPTQDKPSLLTHREVETLLHELGHGVHALCSDVTYQSLAGTSVMRDFVELPSQLQENWACERQALDLFSGHFETGEKIPQDLLDKLRASRKFMVGMAGLRQISFATLDMAWHTADASKIDSVSEFEDNAMRDVALFPRASGAFSNAFSHIFAGGYSAGYYGYKWAEVLDADAFEAFLDKGLYDQKTALEFKHEVLSKGGSEKPDILYKRFRGRDADPKALLRREGLAE